MNKKLINVFLGLCVVGLLFITWRSIRDTEDFGAEVTARENVVKSRLMEIRSAEEAYKAQFGEYCADWSVLINFVKTGRLPVVMKQGVLSDKQMEQIASKTANIILRKMKEDNEPTPEMVSVKEAARILRISEAHMRRIKDQYPHMKIGDKNQGRLLFKRDSLLKG